MQPFPRIQKIRCNSGPSVSGSFIDDEWVWHYIVSGSWDFRMGGQSWRVEAGDSILIPPRLLHVVTVAAPDAHGELLQEVIHFNLSPTSFTSDYTHVITLPVRDRTRVRRWFREIGELWCNGVPEVLGDLGRMLEASGLLMAILGTHLRNGQRARVSSPAAATGWLEVERAVSYLQQNYARTSLVLNEVSQAAGVTPNYLCRIFMRNMGCSVMGYLGACRLEQAEVLLLSSKLNCSQIAEHTGFSSLHVFSHAFRRVRGMSPSQFRARYVGRLVT